MLSDALIFQIWPTHAIIWLCCLLIGATAGGFLANQTERRWTAALIFVGIVFCFVFALVQIVDAAITVTSIPDLSSWDALLTAYFEFTEFDLFFRDPTHQRIVLESTAVGLILWLVAGLGLMFFRWQDD